jgi:hypothetical protein
VSLVLDVHDIVGIITLDEIDTRTQQLFSMNGTPSTRLLGGGEGRGGPKLASFAGFIGQTSP